MRKEIWRCRKSIQHSGGTCFAATKLQPMVPGCIWGVLTDKRLIHSSRYRLRSGVASSYVCSVPLLEAAGCYLAASQYQGLPGHVSPAAMLGG
jgi:hypothetical protein